MYYGVLPQLFIFLPFVLCSTDTICNHCRIVSGCQVAFQLNQNCSAFFQFVWLFRDRPLECRLNLQLFLNGTVLIFNGWSNAGFALVFSISNPSDILYHAVDREKQQAFERTFLCNRTMRKCNNQHTMQQSHMPHILF